MKLSVLANNKNLLLALQMPLLPPPLLFFLQMRINRLVFIALHDVKEKRVAFSSGEERREQPLHAVGKGSRGMGQGRQEADGGGEGGQEG